MNNNIDENKEKDNEKINNVNNTNIIKAIPEKKRLDIFSFAGIIDDQLKEKFSRRVLKLSTTKKSKVGNSSFMINIEQIEQKTKNLVTLEPFFSEFNNLMDKNGDKILSEISCVSSEDKFESNKIIYKYGDEIDKFYIIYEGQVELFFPFTEEVYMNIDEFYIYILRLRRYNEIEMLNDVLLLNEGKFLKEIGRKFNIDKYIYKLYMSYLKLKYDPDYLKEDNKKNKSINSGINSYNNYIFDYEDTFDDKEIKEMILRISDELIETIKYIMPEKMYEIVEERTENRFEKKIINIPKKLIQIFKKLNPRNIINSQNYYERILPKKIINDKLPSEKIIIMKYLKLDILKKGQTFGDFNLDSFALFSHQYLNIMKNTNLKQLKPHKYHNFRNMTVISLTPIHLYSFGRTIYTNYFRKYIEKKTYNKKTYILNHPLFANTNNKNLLNTYSICFKEEILKEGDNIIKENDPLKELNIFIYFIIKGECQLSCYKTIPQIDEIIKILGKEDYIKDTYNKDIKDILNTPQYEELIKDPIKIKLNYLTKNDIIGLTEYFDKDKYFINVNCTQKGTKIYKVDYRIIKLFIDSDEVIKENKDQIIYDKYKLLGEILINQRKMFFDSFLNIEKIKLDIDTGYKPNKIKYKSLPQINTYKANMLSYPKNKNKNNSIFSDYYPKSVTNKINNKTKLCHFNEDLDQLLININHRFTLRDRRIDKSNELRKKLKEKMEKMIKEKEIKINMMKTTEKKEKNLEKEIVFDKQFGTFRKSRSLFRNIFRILPSLKSNSLNNFDSQYELVLPYD